MFDKLRKAFTKAAKGIGQKELTEKVLDDALLELQIALLESDVAEEVVDYLSTKLKEELLGLKLEKEQEATTIVQSKLQIAVAEIFARGSTLDLIEKIRKKKETKAGPFVIVFLGINGTGKTTTVAKIANLLRKAGFSVVVAAGDTHRAGAIEQLEQHTNRLSLKIVKQRYGADPSSVGRDAYDHAKKNYVDVVLMDTAGRMQTSKNLMDEMGKIVRVVKPDVKLFIGDALAGNDTINQAREFFQHTNFDGAILTKVDADAKGGAAISIVHITSRPVVYIGVGQGYDDIIPFDPDKFIGSLFGGVTEVSVENLKSTAKEPELVIEKHELDEAVKLKGKEEKEELLPLPKSSVRQSSPSVSIFAPKTEQNTEPNLPKSVTHQPEPLQDEEQPKEKKKSRFGLFGRKRTNDDRSKGEEEDKREKKQRLEEKQSTEEDRDKHRDEEGVEEGYIVDKQMQKEKRGQQDEDKIVYLTDEDIEDLLK
ncbi:MAG: signal recognition particle-docking protein FtsY [Thermoproteota archaeon]|nr:signal recognition particle-docking protein FtsY [Thermoproteota archaeon]